MHLLAGRQVDAFLVENDRLDREILRILQSDGRRSYTDQGEAVHLSANAGADRVRRTTKNGTILGVRAIVDRAALGMTIEAQIDVKLWPTTTAEAFERTIGELPQVLSATLLTGSFEETTGPDMQDAIEAELLAARTVPFASDEAAWTDRYVTATSRLAQTPIRARWRGPRAPPGSRTAGPIRQWLRAWSTSSGRSRRLTRSRRPPAPGPRPTTRVASADQRWRRARAKPAIEARPASMSASAPGSGTALTLPMPSLKWKP
jgi:DNA-binding Lrp family transcriptional regulator